MDNVKLLEQSYLKQIKLLGDSLQSESERGKIILLAQHVDDLLEQILKKYLKPKKTAKDDKQDKLFDAMMPLSSFAAHIEAAFRLGLISKDAADCYDVLRKIRNACAHGLEPYSFTAPKHSDKFSDLKRLSYKISGMDVLCNLLDQLGDNEQMFVFICMTHVIHLQSRLITITETPDRFNTLPSIEQQKGFYKTHTLFGKPK